MLLQARGVQQTTCARVAGAHRATKDKRTTLVTEKDVVDNGGRANKKPHIKETSPARCARVAGAHRATTQKINTVGAKNEVTTTVA